MNWKLWVGLFPLVIFFVVVLFLWRGLSMDPSELPSALVNKPVPSFTLRRLDSNTKLLEEVDLRGKVTLLNFWASWCEMCLKEHTLLQRISETGMVQIYGINYKDKAEDARAYLQQHGNPYEAVGYDGAGETSINFGIYGVPETFVIDKQGIVRFRHAGPVTRLIWVRQILPLVMQLDGEAL